MWSDAPEPYVIRRTGAPGPGAIGTRAEDFLRGLGGPSWIVVPGRDSRRARVVATLVHGNEPSGVRAVHAWLRSGAMPAVGVHLFILSVEAALAPPGFVHRMLPGRADLNRCFRPPYAGPDGAVARELLERLRGLRPEALIDLHNNTGHNPPYGVGSGVTREQLALAARFGRHYVHSELTLGALVEASAALCPSVTIECGRAGDPAADAVALEGLRDFLAAEHVFELSSPAPELLVEPVRVEVRPGMRVAFAERPRPDVDFTIAGDVDRHNFEDLPTGTSIGWVREGVWPLLARDASGRDLARELFAVEAGALRTLRPIVPIMMTTDAVVARADCLFYVVRRS